MFQALLEFHFITSVLLNANRYEIDCAYSEHSFTVAPEAPLKTNRKLMKLIMNNLRMLVGQTTETREIFGETPCLPNSPNCRGKSFRVHGGTSTRLPVLMLWDLCN